MLYAISTIKLIAEVVGLCLIGQGIVFIFAGARREKNIPYQILKVITSPVVKLLRAITPRLILDQHLGLLAFLLVALIWYWSSSYKLSLCVTEYSQDPLCAEMIQKLQERAAGNRG